MRGAKGFLLGAAAKAGGVLFLYLGTCAAASLWCYVSGDTFSTYDPGITFVFVTILVLWLLDYVLEYRRHPVNPVTAAINANSEMLENVARGIERGRLPAMSGAEALRYVAASMRDANEKLRGI